MGEEQNKKNGEMVKVEVELYSPFNDFIEAYVAFFGKETTPKDFMRDAIYDAVRTVYSELEDISTKDVSIPTGIMKGDWLARFRNIAHITLQ